VSDYCGYWEGDRPELFCTQLRAGVCEPTRLWHGDTIIADHNLFRELVRAVLDPAIADPHLRRTIYQRIPLAVLRRAAAESDRIVRPLDDSYVDFFETRYGYLRQCTPVLRNNSILIPLDVASPNDDNR
jgi:hypothetical protein